MSTSKRPVRGTSPLRAELPRILVLLGVGFMILGAIATAAFVAGDSSCNAGTNMSGGGPLSLPGNGFCGHAQGFETASFMILVAGVVMLTFGSMILPTLRERDARRAAAADPLRSDQEDVDEEL